MALSELTDRSMPSIPAHRDRDEYLAWVREQEVREAPAAVESVAGEEPEDAPRRRSPMVAALAVLAAGSAAAVFALAVFAGAGSEPSAPPVTAPPQATVTTASAAPVVPPAQVQHSGREAGSHLASYEVQAGDTLTSIAAEIGTTVEVLRYLNPGQDPDLLIEGARLRIPANTTTVP